MERKRFCLHCGLTLPEAIIVLLIIAVVAAVVAPLITAAYGTRRANCQNNIRECAIALQTYWTDYDSTLPSSAVVSRSKRWKQGDFVRFATRLGRIPVPTNVSPRTWTQALYCHMKSRDIMFCTHDETNRYKDESKVSYYWKTAVDKAWYGVGCKRPQRKLSDYKHAADQIIFYERAGFHDQRGRLWWKHTPGLENRIFINVVFLDTHVRSHQLTNATTDDPNHPELATNGEPMYFNYDQDKKRGPGNPPAVGVPAKYVDPSRYSDLLP